MAGFLGKVLGAGANVVRRVRYGKDYEAILAVKRALGASTHGANVKAGNIRFVGGSDVKYVERPVSARYSGGGTNVAKLRRLELPEGQSLDGFLPEVKHTKDAFAVIASAEGGNPDSMLLLSDRFISRAKLLESSGIQEQLNGNNLISLNDLSTRIKRLRNMAMTLLAESAKRGNDKAQTRLMELVSQGRK